MKNIVKRIINKVKDVIDNLYQFNIESEYLYYGVFIEVTSGPEVGSIIMKENFHKGMKVFDILQALKDLEEMDYRYFHIREYKERGLFVYLSNSRKRLYDVNEKRGYRDITIPVRSNYQDIQNLLENLLMAREFYSAYEMDDIATNMNETMITIGSNIMELNMSIDELKDSLIMDDIDAEYCDKYALIPSKPGSNRYQLVPLYNIKVTKWREDGIIISRDQLYREVIPIIEFITQAYRPNHQTVA